MDVRPAEVPFTALGEYVERSFRELAQEKGLRFSVELDERLPEAIFTDPLRLQQVLRNLLANAFKFTDEGSVILRVEVATEGWSRGHEILSRAQSVIAFSVIDTGVGIAPDRHRLIFEAFQQGDGTSSRHHSGTGLGLSISREIATLIAGEIRLASRPGVGSTFTLYLPHSFPSAGLRGRPWGGSEVGDGTSPPASWAPAFASLRPSAVARSAAAAPGAVTTPEPPIGVRSAWPGLGSSLRTSASTPRLLPGDLRDDRDTIRTGDQILLIVEDDVPFARVLLDRAREMGFKGIVTTRGEMAPKLAREFHPHAITLDIRLPDSDGWAVLDRLKHDPETRHIPVHIITVTEERQRGLRRGALAYLHKPVSREGLDRTLASIKEFIERQVKRLLVVDDDEVQRRSIEELTADGTIETRAARSGAEALEALEADRFDCVVLDLGLPDMTGLELIEKIRSQERLSGLPIIVYTAKGLTQEEESELQRLSETTVVKEVKSLEQLLDETSLFLHRVQADLPAPQREMLEQARRADPGLAGKTVLVVDDDIRNIYALTSLLERHQMQVLAAENGQEAMETLQTRPEVNLVLMDIMMPGMDGYETIRAIRRQAPLGSLPIIALTAKAMQEDRASCLDSGASDYIAKPVDTEQLLSLLRVWLDR
jgi:CheY-like chemotaxis protein